MLVIRDNFKAWGLKDEHGTFETYCRAKWGMSRMHASRLIEAVGVVEDVKCNPGVTPPSCEKHARALAAAPPEKRAEVWQEAVETAPQGKVTAKHIKEVVNRATGEALAHPRRQIVALI